MQEGPNVLIDDLSLINVNFVVHSWTVPAANPDVALRVLTEPLVRDLSRMTRLELFVSQRLEVLILVELF